jgi:hypothetical protein
VVTKKSGIIVIPDFLQTTKNLTYPKKMKLKRKSSITDEKFQRATDDIIEQIMEETRQELIPRLRKDNAEKNSKKNVTPVAAGQ